MRRLVFGLCLLWALPAAAADCSAIGISQARAQFRAAYDAKDYDQAQAILDPVWRDCIAENRPIDPVLGASISNDFALTLHRAGDDGFCMGVLQDYGPGLKRDNAAMAKLPQRLREAIRFNYKLCLKFCETEPMDPSCQAADWDAQRNAMVESDFRAPACPFPVNGLAAIGLGDGSCLSVLPPIEEVEYGDREKANPAKACPRLSLSRQQDGKTISQSVALPRTSFVQATRFCCTPIILATDDKGRIEITPEENPPEDCLSGHRVGILQDVLQLQGRRMTLLHRMFKFED